MMAFYAHAGESNLRIQYEPFSFRLGLFISCLTAMLLCGGAVFYRYPRPAHPWKRKLSPAKRRTY